MQARACPQVPPPAPRRLLPRLPLRRYTANSAAILTTAHLNPEFRVNAFGDLAGKAVGTG